MTKPLFTGANVLGTIARAQTDEDLMRIGDHLERIPHDDPDHDAVAQSFRKRAHDVGLDQTLAESFIGKMTDAKGNSHPTYDPCGNPGRLGDTGIEAAAIPSDGA